MTVITITYEAKCKHCRNCATIRRKTYCTKNVPEPKLDAYIMYKGGIPIRQKDKACKDFKL